MTLQSREAKIETSTDNRNRRRHKLSLEVEAKDLASTPGSVTVYDISSTGLLIETDLRLSVGEMIEVELPRVGFQTAEIVWASGQLVGCKFARELTQGAVSAARLEGSHETTLSNERVHTSASNGDAYVRNTDTSAEKLSTGVTLRILFGLAIFAWLVVGLIGYVLLS